MNTEQARQVADCEDREGELSEFEAKFIDSIGFRTDRDLTKKQANYLDTIWARVTTDVPIIHR